MACVLIVTALDDAATDEVISRLRNRGIPHKRLNTDAYPFSFPLTFQPDELTCRRQITLDGDWLPQPSSIWYRRVRTPPKPQNMDDEVYTFCVRAAGATLTGSILCLRSAWMSHPSAVWQAEHKPLQLATAVQCGLRIPSTVITNDPNVIRVFFDKHRETIVKPAHSGNVTKGGQQFSIFTSQLLEEHLEHLHTASLSPSIYQALIRKRFDVRVTIVGHQIFAAAIDSQSDPSAALDWRQANSRLAPHHQSSGRKSTAD